MYLGLINNIKSVKESVRFDIFSTNNFQFVQDGNHSFAIYVEIDNWRIPLKIKYVRLINYSLKRNNVGCFKLILFFYE